MVFFSFQGDQEETVRIFSQILLTIFTETIQLISTVILALPLSLSGAFSLFFSALSVVHIVQLALLCSLSGQLQIPWQK